VATEFRAFCTYAVFVTEHTEVKDPDTGRICARGRGEGGMPEVPKALT
jgi:hypothetical protein